MIRKFSQSPVPCYLYLLILEVRFMWNSRFFIVTSLILAAAVSRLIHLPGNFSPVMAIALFAGAHLSNKKDALWIPAAGMFLSDLFLGFHSLQILVYGLMLCTVVLGWQLRSVSSPARILGSSFFGSILFFAVTNLFVWLTSGMYELNLSGFIQCYALAVPFFQNSLAGDLLFTGLFFGLAYYLEKKSVISPVTA